MDEIIEKLESILFVASKPLKPSYLAKLLETSEDIVATALLQLADKQRQSGIVLLATTGGYQFATHASNTELVKKFLNADLREKLTDATIEVLAIIAYREPISKTEIESIRGVNSQYSIRHLLMRGLVEKVPNPTDSRSSLYQLTTDALMHFGLTKNTELPNFETISTKVKLPETLADSDNSSPPLVSDIELSTEE